jgi:hypothetical protein
MTHAYYFGPECSRKDYETQVAAPVGTPCIWCEEPIGALDMGTINAAGQVSHYECSIRSIAGSVGHQKRLCSCFGGDQEDPPGMTRRQAAVAAMTYFHKTKPYYPPGEDA